MHRFIKNIFLFLFFLQLPLLVESFLPNTFLSLRPGEALTKLYTAIYGSYFANQSIEMEEVGNMAMGTKYEIKKHTKTYKDKYGFRNREFFNAPDLILVGDSQIVCASVSQEEILSEQLMRKTNLKTNNIAIGSPKVFARMQQLNLFKKPKFIVFEKVERELPEYKFDVNTQPTLIEKAKFITLNNYFINLFSDWVSKYTRNYITLFIKSNTLGRHEFTQSIKDSAMFFHDGATSEVNLTDQEINLLVEEMVKTRDYFENQGIKFAFMPFPNKETIYWEHLPFEKQPDFLFKLIKKLEEKNVKVINTLDALNKQKRISKDYLYHTDDTHWNKNGIKSASDEILKFINF